MVRRILSLSILAAATVILLADPASAGGTGGTSTPALTESNPWHWVIRISLIALGAFGAGLIMDNFREGTFALFLGGLALFVVATVWSSIMPTAHRPTHYGQLVEQRHEACAVLYFDDLAKSAACNAAYIGIGNS